MNINFGHLKTYAKFLKDNVLDDTKAQGDCILLDFGKQAAYIVGKAYVEVQIPLSLEDGEAVPPSLMIQADPLLTLIGSFSELSYDGKFFRHEKDSFEFPKRGEVEQMPTILLNKQVALPLTETLFHSLTRASMFRSKDNPNDPNSNLIIADGNVIGTILTSFYEDNLHLDIPNLCIPSCIAQAIHVSGSQAANRKYDGFYLQVTPRDENDLGGHILFVNEDVISIQAPRFNEDDDIINVCPRGDYPKDFRQTYDHPTAFTVETKTLIDILTFLKGFSEGSTAYRISMSVDGLDSEMTLDLQGEVHLTRKLPVLAMTDATAFKGQKFWVSCDTFLRVVSAFASEKETTLQVDLTDTYPALNVKAEGVSYHVAFSHMENVLEAD